MKYFSSVCGMWPTTKSLSWDAQATFRLCELRAVVYCQDHGPGKAQGGADCLTMGPPWAIFEFVVQGSQGDTGWSKPIPLGQ